MLSNLVAHGAKSESQLLHLQRLTLWGRESTEAAMERQTGVLEVQPQSHPIACHFFSLMAKKWLTLARELAWSSCALCCSFQFIVGFTCNLLSWSIGALFHCGDDLFSGVQLLESPCVLLACLHSARKRQVGFTDVISRCTYLDTGAFLKQLAYRGNVQTIGLEMN